MEAGDAHSDNNVAADKNGDTYSAVLDIPERTAKNSLEGHLI